jgi:hypothetical protein
MRKREYNLPPASKVPAFLVKVLQQISFKYPQSYSPCSTYVLNIYQISHLSLSISFAVRWTVIIIQTGHHFLNKEWCVVYT